jgi:predicted permease
MRFWFSGRQRRQKQLEQELQTHLQMAASDRIDRGESPDSADQATRREFGNVALVLEVSRDQWGWRWLEDLLQDLRYATRIMARSPGFTSLLILTLALGIGANTSIFSLINTFLLKTLPVSNPEQLVFVRAAVAKGRTQRDFPFPAFERLRDTSRSFAGMFAWDDASASVTIDGRANLVSADFVSGSYFDVLGVSAILGATFSADDDQPGRKPVAVISYPYWQKRFARHPTAIGKTIFVGRIPFTIIGVTLPDFSGRNVAGAPADIVLPMWLHPQLALGDHDAFQIMARLKAGSVVTQARAELDLIYKQFLQEEAGARLSAQNEEEIRAQEIVLEPASRGTGLPTDNFALEMRILAGVVAVSLLIASVNVACLLLARAAARQKEIAMRIAIGARRARLVRQLLTESALLAVLGGGLGLLFAKWGAAFLLTVLSAGEAQIHFDWRILAFTTALSLLTAVLFGLAPALAGTRIDLNSILKGAEGRSESGSGHRRLTESFVVLQVALSLTLLIGAGLLARSLQFLYAVDAGFERRNVLQLWALPALNGYDHTSEMKLYQAMLVKLNAIPGVRSASLSRLRMIYGRWNRNVWLPRSQPEANREVYCDPVGPRFFETMGIPRLLGREFSGADTATSPKVAIISETMAREFFPDQNPLGRRFRFDREESDSGAEIVGVVKDIRHHLDKTESRAAVFIPYTQAPTNMYGQMNFVLRTSANPASIIPTVRATVQSIDKNLPLVGIATQEVEIDEYFGSHRSLTTLLGIFAGLALLLASIGLFGTMSYAVARRTKELGIRLALGAQRVELMQMVLRETCYLVAVGIVIGVPLAITASQLLSSMLFSIKGNDPMSIGGAIAFMVLIALLAGYLPARRATRVDPMAALRCE